MSKPEPGVKNEVRHIRQGVENAVMLPEVDHELFSKCFAEFLCAYYGAVKGNEATAALKAVRKICPDATWTEFESLGMRCLEFFKIVDQQAERIQAKDQGLIDIWDAIAKLPESWTDVAACGPLVRSREFESQLFQGPQVEATEEHGPFFEENQKLIAQASAMRGDPNLSSEKV